MVLKDSSSFIMIPDDWPFELKHIQLIAYKWK
jgi:hypothetical protein